MDCKSACVSPTSPVLVRNPSFPRGSSPVISPGISGYLHVNLDVSRAAQDSGLNHWCYLRLLSPKVVAGNDAITAVASPHSVNDIFSFPEPLCSPSCSMKTLTISSTAHLSSAHKETLLPSFFFNS